MVIDDFLPRPACGERAGVRGGKISAKTPEVVNRHGIAALVTIVELDGGQHAEQVAPDAERTACLESKGIRIIRFWNDDALKQTNTVLEEILRQLHAPHPGPLPASGAREKTSNAQRATNNVVAAVLK
ncbi:MAG: DUF559 domain-containing protein [Betaproteobacteria bacterium]|nr:DUF559 domain-containing protein [Betaproteobacteria bacterium]MBI3057173.1 DUF559 domain-containing protein [Betaproteobacteria bacterium]